MITGVVGIGSKRSDSVSNLVLAVCYYIDTLLGDLFPRRLQEAWDMKIKQETIFEEFTQTVPHAILTTWKAAIELWEADPYKNPDPFVE